MLYPTAPATSAPQPVAALMAFIRRTGAAPHTEREPEWLPLCYRLTPRLERLSATAALLDLGTSSPDEARALLTPLLDHLAGQCVPVRAGIGSSGTLAQLALLSAPAGERLALAPPAVATWLQAVPLRLLGALAPAGLIAPEVITRLERYGLRTLGQLARLGEPTLRRQFGDQPGAMLAALCRGEDLHPLQPTPPAHWHRARLRLLPAVAPEQALAALPQLVRRALPLLAGHRAQALRLVLRWESGARQELAAVLRAHTADPEQLLQEARRLLLTLLGARPAAAPADLVEELRLALGACVPGAPQQSAMWQRQQQREAAVRRLAANLERRHGRPLMLRPHLAAGEAIFAEERYRLLPTGTTGAAPPAHAAAVGQSGDSAPYDLYDPHSAYDPAAASAWDQVPQRRHWW